MTAFTREDIPVTVILRRFRDGDLIALMPEEPSDEHGLYVTSYMHVGQHGAADYDHVVRITSPVLMIEPDVDDLLRELRTIGYRVTLAQRRTRTMREHARRAAQS